MSNDDNNDIRLALGAIRNRLNEVATQIADIHAMASRSVRLAEVVDDLETIVRTLPDALERAASDPTLAVLAGPQLRELAEVLRTAVGRRREAAASAPSVESITD